MNYFILAETTTNDLITPFFGLLSIIVSSIGTLVVKHWLDTRKREDVNELSDAEIKLTLSEVNEINQRVLDLENSVHVDRFLILKAENGKSDPRFATVIYEQYRNREPFIASLVYRKIRIDDYYREMLKTTEANDLLQMETAKMPQDAKLKGFYENELVLFSNCYFLTRYQLHNTEKWIVLYCTVATKQDKPFSRRDTNQIGLFIDYLKEILTARVPKEKK
jgi:hypothetical protein